MLYLVMVVVCILDLITGGIFDFVRVLAMIGILAFALPFSDLYDGSGLHQLIGLAGFILTGVAFVLKGGTFQILTNGLF